MPPLKPPYFTAIFSSQRTQATRCEEASISYEEMADRMARLAEESDGFLGMESYRDADGRGVTISYWRTLDAIRNWGQDPRHLEAQSTGQKIWYEQYSLRIARVESETVWQRDKV
ncbi:MAG: antibiotic biosynthesis monooxygenase [Planctomycetota bacterium]|nr:antibiotic biosynthesis monooxygenase [Planctomycetota bacterium]